MTEGGGGNENARLTGRVPVLIRDRVGGRRGGGGGKHGEEGAALDTSQMQAENSHVPHGATRLHVAGSCAVAAVHNATIVTHAAAAAAAAVHNETFLDGAGNIKCCDRLHESALSASCASVRDHLHWHTLVDRSVVPAIAHV
jgi:hypothetical protein